MIAISHILPTRSAGGAYWVIFSMAAVLGVCCLALLLRDIYSRRNDKKVVQEIRRDYRQQLRDMEVQWEGSELALVRDMLGIRRIDRSGPHFFAMRLVKYFRSDNGTWIRGILVAMAVLVAAVLGAILVH